MERDYSEVNRTAQGIFDNGKKIFFAGLLLGGLSYLVPHKSYEPETLENHRPAIERLSEMDYSTFLSKSLFVGGISVILGSYWKTKGGLQRLAEENEVEINLDIDVKSVNVRDFR
ncbi:hypothetical protein HOD75_00370 [archaeon]|jgi:hypothetical protein|nr:hypothetical protein [archaeon]MBT4241330.1 hypothetical protein [archaeon]MBT4418151.1 hypothetical protein [archaeon]